MSSEKGGSWNGGKLDSVFDVKIVIFCNDHLKLRSFLIYLSVVPNVGRYLIELS